MTDTFLDAEGKPQTLLNVLYEVGFTREQLIAVLNHTGGSRNLTALIKLTDTFLDAEGKPRALYNVLSEAGFTLEQFIAVLKHDGGSHNLATLCQLTNTFTDAEGNTHTLLNVLSDVGFTPSQLIAVLKNDGGSHTLKALISLLKSVQPSAECSSIAQFLKTQAQARKALFSLAITQSKSSHLYLLKALWNDETYRPNLSNSERFISFCITIKKMTVQQLKFNAEFKPYFSSIKEFELIEKRESRTESKAYPFFRRGNGSSNPACSISASELPAVFESRDLKLLNFFKPVSAQLDPVSAQLDPVSAQLDPVSAQLDPVSTQLDPVSTQLDPVSSLFDPVSSLFDPVLSLFDPVLSLFDPVLSLFDPVLSTSHGELWGTEVHSPWGF